MVSFINNNKIILIVQNILIKMLNLLKKGGFMQRKFWKTLLLLVVLAITAGNPALAANYDYDLTNLGLLARTNLTGSRLITDPAKRYVGSEAYGINDSGLVVGMLAGRFQYANGNPGGNYNLKHAMTWTGTITTAVDLALPIVGGNLGKAYSYGVNSSGQVVGTTQKDGKQHAFRRDTDGTFTDIGMPSGAVQTFAKAINYSGQIVGWATNQTGSVLPSTAFIYNPTTSAINYIPGALPNASAATSINNSGIVTGYTGSSFTADTNAFIYNSVTNTFSKLSTLGGASSYGADINDSGAVVGSSTLASGVSHAFIYNNGVMTDLGALVSASNTSSANAINNAGVIVGSSNGHAFVYRNGEMLDLNDLINPASYFTLTNATDINILGQIVGMGTYNDGVNTYSDAFMLTLNPSAVPIPPAIFLFGSGIAGLAAIRRKKWF
jgi:probable HAF family extracellular repeat protein